MREILRSPFLAAHYIGSTILIIAALFIGWSGASRWIANGALSDAVVLAETGRMTEALPAVERALWWRPGDADALLLQAKLLLAAGKPAEAETIYRRLASERERHAQAHIGLAAAAIALSEGALSEGALSEGSAGETGGALKYLERARTAFGDARKINPASFEAAVGEACVSLLEKGADPLGKFLKIEIDHGTPPARETMIDYYVGAATASARARREFSSALSAARRALALAPGRPDATAILLNLEAIDLSRPNPVFDKSETDGFDNVFRLLSETKNDPVLTEACRNYLFTYTWACARTGDIACAMESIRRLNESPVKDRFETLALNGAILQARADGMKTRSERTTIRTRAREFLVKAAACEGAVKTRRSVEFANAIAVILDEESDAYRKPALRAEAVKRLREALASSPDHYPTLRNLLILQKKTGEGTDADGLYAMASTAAGKAGSPYADDLTKLKKYLGR